MSQRFAPYLFGLLLTVISAYGQGLPAVAVFTEDWSLGSTNIGPRFLTAVWPDGRIIWARNQQEGGPPYLTAKIEPVKVQTLLEQFAKPGVFDKPGLRRSWFGPDSSFQVIWLQSGTNTTRLETWHELFERNPKLVVISGGVTTLNRRKREDVIRTDSKEFRDFRQLWTDLRAAVTGLIPADGRDYWGTLELKIPR
jgi:hypothetical protein